MDDAHHPLDLLGRDGPGPALLAQQVHHVRGELVTCLGWQEKQKKPQDGKVIRWCQGQGGYRRRCEWRSHWLGLFRAGSEQECAAAQGMMPYNFGFYIFIFIFLFFKSCTA